MTDQHIHMCSVQRKYNNVVPIDYMITTLYKNMNNSPLLFQNRLATKKTHLAKKIEEIRETIFLQSLLLHERKMTS